MHRTDDDTAEIESLYRQHGPSLLLFALAIVREQGRAQDVVHQVFLNLIEKERLTKALDKKAYLFTWVRNAALNEAKLRDRAAPLDYDSALAWFIPPDRDCIGEQNLRRSLSTLPDDQREVIVLHVWGELTFAQIGELLQVSSNTIASRYRYALGKLRGSLIAEENFCANS